MADLCLQHEVRAAAPTLVMPGHVPGIHPSTSAGAIGEMDPRDKPEDDVLGIPVTTNVIPAQAGTQATWQRRCGRAVLRPADECRMRVSS